MSFSFSVKVAFVSLSSNIFSPQENKEPELPNFPKQPQILFGSRDRRVSRPESSTWPVWRFWGPPKSQRPPSARFAKQTRKRTKAVTAESLPAVMFHQPLPRIPRSGCELRSKRRKTAENARKDPTEPWTWTSQEGAQTVWSSRLVGRAQTWRKRDKHPETSKCAGRQRGTAARPTPCGFRGSSTSAPCIFLERGSFARSVPCCGASPSRVMMNDRVVLPSPCATDEYFLLLLLRRGCASRARPGVQRGWRLEQLQQEGADGVVFSFFLGRAPPAPWARLRTSVNADLCTRVESLQPQFASLPCWLITKSPCAARTGSTNTVPTDQGRPQTEQRTCASCTGHYRLECPATRIALFSHCRHHMTLRSSRLGSGLGTRHRKQQCNRGAAPYLRRSKLGIS